MQKSGKGAEKNASDIEGNYCGSLLAPFAASARFTWKISNESTSASWWEAQSLPVGSKCCIKHQSRNHARACQIKEASTNIQIAFASSFLQCQPIILSLQSHESFTRGARCRRCVAGLAHHQIA
jgi:hypothetical protein